MTTEEFQLLKPGRLLYIPGWYPFYYVVTRWEFGSKGSRRVNVEAACRYDVSHLSMFAAFSDAAAVAEIIG